MPEFNENELFKKIFALITKLINAIRDYFLAAVEDEPKVVE